MKDLNENFAAIAVIGDLYESGKDMYDVLAAYLQIVIASEKMNGFTSVDITDRINRTNSFRVNESIVKTALKRLELERDHGVYYVTKDTPHSINTKELNEQIQQNRLIVDQLCSFIQSELKQSLSDEERESIQKQFYNYLMSPEREDTYSVYISQFVMNHCLDTVFQDVIFRIKEGLLVYEGISFSPEFGQSGKWDFPLDIYLELEVIFYLVGFNGELNREIYEQLIEYVKEINSIGNGNIIRLLYTSDVKAEIENYFSTAEYLFDKHEIVDPSKKAMLHILDSVASKREIQMKKVKLYNSLSRMGIEEININFFSEENQQYNTVTAETYQFNCDAIETNKGDEYIKNCTDRINQINIIRKNKNHTLREAGSVLLTSNGTILKCAYMPNAFTEGDAPKAVNIDYLINRFWYKLNKGFGKGDEPKSIDIISRARIALASMSNSKVSQTYDEIRKQYSDGNITEMEVAGIISELRKVSRNPEDITPDQIDNQIAFLKDYDLEQRIEDVRREELARKKDKETITELRQYINQNEKKQTQLEQEHLERDIQFEKRIKALEEEKSTIEAEKAELYRTVEYYINRDKKKRQTFHRVMRGLIFLIVLIIIAMLLFMGCSYLLKIDRSISGVISILLTLLFQFAKPMKRLWQRFVFEYQLKE